ncbi:MAG TPA: ABC transporter permease [Methylomirabilota bacterium]|nr:ABC transporter permease [Methylomirabilota bacterium]
MSTLEIAREAPGVDGPNADTLARDAARERRRLLGLSLPALVLVGLLLVLPVGWLFYLSVVDQDAYSLVHYQRLVQEPAYVTILWNTVKVSVLVTVICVLLGYPLAYLLAQLPPRAANLGLIVVILPLWTALLVRTYAWLVLLQRRGLVNTLLVNLGLAAEPIPLVHNMTGTVIGMTHILLPFLVLPLYASMRAIDPDYVRAAAGLGASPIRAFRQVFLPLSLPGLTAGLLLVFVLCLGFYVTPALLGGGKTYLVAMKIEQNVNTYFAWGASSSLAVVLLVSVGLLFAVLHRVFAIPRLFGIR